MSGRAARWLPLAAAAAALALAAVGCTGDHGSRPTQRPIERADDPTLSEPLLVALGMAKNYHHQADVHLADGNTQAAIDAVGKVLTIPFPAGAPEGEDTILDARARLGKLYLGIGRLDEAQRAVELGLAAPSRESFFLANLYTVAGEIHEARAAAAGAGDAAAAREERRKALEAYERSLRIAEELQKKVSKEASP